MTTSRHLTVCSLSLAVAGLICLLPDAARAMGPAPPPPPPIDASGDDLFLIQAAVSPNVVLFMDNSQSMNHIEWHPAFDPEQVPDASYCVSSSSSVDYGAAFDPDATYTITADRANQHCDNPVRADRTVYGESGPATPHYWSGRYLMWYLGLDETVPAELAIINEIATAVASVEGCTQAGGSGDFATKYRRTRFEATKQVLLDLLCLAEPKNVRFSSAEFREVAAPANVDPNKDPNGGFLSTDLGRSNPNHAAELESAIKNAAAVSTDGTPLAETLFQIYTYWMSRDINDIPFGEDGITKFPIYEYDKFGNPDIPVQWFEDAMLYDCEKAFVVIVTDGLPSRDDFDFAPVGTALGFGDFAALIGDYNVDAEVEDPMLADESAYYLDDIAKYMYEHDFRPDLDGDQTIDTYVVGFATDSSASEFLGRTAELGNGRFYEVQDGDQLTFALIAALNDIIEKSASFTAATVPSARTEDGADFYQSYFFPRAASAFWEGHIRAWKIDKDGRITQDLPGDPAPCALDDPDAGECDSGPFLPSAVYFWDAAEQVPAAGSRNLSASKGGAKVPFTQAEITAADLFVDVFAVPPAQAPNSALYLVNGSTATTEEGLADEIVAATRGCFFGTGVSTNVATPTACADRPSRLGDVFHANPLPIRGPSLRSAEASYNAYKAYYGARDRVLYAGTNGGFLEAIHTGDWITPALPAKPYYDEGTGVELFGFMPWEARGRIKNLWIDDPTERNHYVDGDANSADVWIHPTPSTPPTSKAVNGSEWRTYFVGGLREGGHHYYALDVTNSSGQTHIVGGTPLPYPGYAWEFPNEADVAGDYVFMGESWARPVITKIRLKDPLDASKVVERWVAIVTAGYDALSDPNPASVSGIVNTYDATAIAGRGIFIIDLKSGGIIAEKKFGSILDPQASMLFSAVGSPSVLDLNFDGFADTIYMGNMGGQVFKWAIGEPGADNVNNASGNRLQPDWPFKLFFEADPVTIGVNTYYKNFFFAPAAAFEGGELFIALGSGERRNLPFGGDPTAGEENRFYVIRDADPYERFVVPIPTITEADLTDFSGSESAQSFANKGFYITVGDGEKFVTNVEIFSGDIIAATFTPTTDPNPCVAKGNGSLYVFDLLTGEGHFEDGSNNPDRNLALGPGLPTDPKVSIGVGGKKNKVVIEKSGSDIEIIDADNVGANGATLFWKEAY
jgi:type IV pilus assembly protein PilY1